MYCRSCAYNLTGVPKGQCPECGRTFDSSEPNSYDEFSGQTARRRAYPLLALLTVVLAAILWYCFQTDSPGELMLVIISGGPGLVALFLWIQLRTAPLVMTFVVISIVPSILMILLFYSLAVHMHQALGGWPKSIGNSGFTAALDIHADLTQSWFGILALCNFFLLPIVIVACACFKFSRNYLGYLGAYAVSYAIGIGALLLAPAQFLNWWWD